MPETPLVINKRAPIPENIPKKSRPKGTAKKVLTLGS
jgi:hypothetical protein